MLGRIEIPDGTLLDYVIAACEGVAFGVAITFSYWGLDWLAAQLP
jgi:hypothetical protein